MNDKEYRAKIDEVKALFAASAGGKSVGVVVPAAMEIVLGAIMSVEDKEEAAAATASLRPMIDYIEGQLRGHH